MRAKTNWRDGWRSSLAGRESSAKVGSDDAGQPDRAVAGRSNRSPTTAKRGLWGVVNTSFIASVGAYSDAAYTVANWAIRRLTKNAVLEFADWGA